MRQLSSRAAHAFTERRHVRVVWRKALASVLLALPLGIAITAIPTATTDDTNEAETSVFGAVVSLQCQFDRADLKNVGYIAMGLLR